MSRNEVTETIEIKEYFTDTQLKEISETLAKETVHRQKLEEEKKKVVSSYTAKINSKKTIIEEFAKHIDDGFRMKEVKALVLFNVPEEGQKSFVSPENNTFVYAIEDMTEFEKENPTIW